MFLGFENLGDGSSDGIGWFCDALSPSLFLKQILDVNNISNEFYFSLRCLIIFAEVFKISEANNGIYGICGNKLGEN